MDKTLSEKNYNDFGYTEDQNVETVFTNYLQDKLNSTGTVGSDKSLGECAAIYKLKEDRYEACLFIGDKNLRDSSMVAEWIKDAGAIDVMISHVLHEDIDNCKDGYTEDGLQYWLVSFHFEKKNLWKKIETKEELMEKEKAEFFSTWGGE